MRCTIPCIALTFVALPCTVLTLKILGMGMLFQSRCRLLEICQQTHLLPLPDNGRISAYYQTTLDNGDAPKIVLDLFRRAYPFAPIFLYTDNAKNHTLDLAMYEPIIRQPFTKLLNSVAWNGMYFATVDAAVAFLERVVEASLDVDWVILLEDDVWVCDKFFTSALKFDMNGQCIAKYGGYDNLVPGPCYGGCGGFILRAAFLRKLHVDREYITTLLQKIKRGIASDELISAMFYHSNGTIGRFSGYSEWMSSEPVIVHQIKRFYHQANNCM